VETCSPNSLTIRDDARRACLCVAPGQTVDLYDGDLVLGGAKIASTARRITQSNS
jgi:tRNA U34 2-thiouridine synthase MnmA/TrmU